MPLGTELFLSAFDSPLKLKSQAANAQERHERTPSLLYTRLSAPDTSVSAPGTSRLNRLFVVTGAFRSKANR
jgi:hypothetical protein